MRCASGVQVREHFTYKLGLSAHTPSTIFILQFAFGEEGGCEEGAAWVSTPRVFYSGQFLPEAGSGQGLAHSFWCRGAGVEQISARPVNPLNPNYSESRGIYLNTSQHSSRDTASLSIDLELDIRGQFVIPTSSPYSA